MPISGYFIHPFGVDGELATVPDPIQGDGTVSYDQGFGVDYTLPSSNPSYKYMPWGQFNQLFYDITLAVQTIQRGSPPAFITSTMNGGSAYSYPAGAIVSLSGVNYVSLVGSNTDTPPSSKWAVDVNGAGALLAANNLSDVASAATSRTNLGAAPVASPTFTGTPAAPTAPPGTNTTQIASTAFVAAAAAAVVTYKKGATLTLSPYTLSANGSQAHGLTGTPRVQGYLECLTAEHGYGVGARIPFDGSSSATGNSNMIMWADATNIYYTTNYTDLPDIGDTSTFNRVPITAANWKVVMTPIIF